jgi:hypothetical protein
MPEARGRVIASATPYPWPYHGAFDPSATALVAIVDSTWRRAGPAADRSDAKLGQIASALASLGGLVIAVDAVPGRQSWRAHAEPPSAEPFELAIEADCHINAGATSAFYASALDDVLRQNHRLDLIICGWGLEGPVHSTLRAANDIGFECVLVPDASTALDDALVPASQSMVEFSGGIFGAVATTEGVLSLFAEAIK